MNSDNLIITNGNRMGSADLASLAVVLQAVNENGLSITEEFEGSIWFNLNSWNVYAVCEWKYGEYDLAVISCFGQSASFLVTDRDTGEETEFETLSEAETFAEWKDEDEYEDEDE